MFRLPKKSKKFYFLSGSLLLSLVVLVCLVWLFSDLVYPSRTGPDRQTSTTADVNSLKPAHPITTSTTAPASVDVPVRLVIPKLQIDASVEPVSILSDGELQTPKNEPYTDVGWYSYGPKPGAVGSSVIDGHLDQPGGDPAIFATLHNLQVGDQIQVQTKSSQTLQFVVNKISYYQPQDAPLQSIFGDSSGRYLNLITCAGVWVPSQQQTTLRVVVYTSLV